MKAATLVLMFAGLLGAQESPPATPPPGERQGQEKPDSRQKARALLDGAAEMVASVQPQIQVVGLMHLADNYHLLDSRKSLEYFQQAFAAAAALPFDSRADHRGTLQAAIVRRAADVSLPEAIQMLRQVPATAGRSDPRASAVEKVVQLLLQKPDFDQAIEVVDSVGATGEYPFRSVGLIFRKLPSGDARRITVFGSAMAAFAGRPRGPFPELLGRCWREIPRPMAEAALQTVLNAILDRKDATFMTQTISSAKGSVSLSSRQDAELFEIMHVLRALDPKRAADLLETRPELRAAVERFPEGTASMRDGDKDDLSIRAMIGNRPSPQRQQEEQLRALADNRAAAALGALTEDPQKALSLVRTIPLASKQAEVLGTVARSVGQKDPGTARSVLNQCVSILDDIKNPLERLTTWDIVAEAAHQIGDEKLAWQAIDRAMADATALYKADTDVESPNTALREYWPSTQSYRRIVAIATKLFGVDAEPLLVKITDPDLALLARIEMAQALLGRQRTQGSVMVEKRGR